MSQAVTNFVSELALHFHKRFDSEAAEDSWLQSMYRNLRPYPPSVLRRACQRIIDTRKDRYFPLPAECKKVCDEIEKIERSEQAPKLVDPTHKLAGNSDWQFRLADDLIQCSLGRRAAQEGWILSLHDFARVKGRIPTQEYEIRQCITSARGFDEAYEELLREKALGRSTSLQNSLIQLGDMMRQRREKYRQMVLGREAA